MALLLMKMYDAYDYLNNDISDVRTRDFPLISSPISVIGILAIYLIFVLNVGPKWMENRKPFQIQKFIVAFDLLQIILCGKLVYEFMLNAFFQISWRCQPIDYSYSTLPLKYANYTWIYFAIKILDLLDTVFFVLRKKQSHISFLHVYHHTGMVILTWIGTKYMAGGHGLFLGFANCIVHMVMYFYYLLTAWDPKYKESVWWKKHITQLQIAQFLFMIIMFGQILFQPTCEYPRWAVLSFLPQNFFMLMLFSDFYRREYILKNRKAKKNVDEVKSS